MPASFTSMDSESENHALGNPRRFMAVEKRSSGQVLVIMQRVHPSDLTRHLNLQSGNSYDHLVLSAIALWDEEWTLRNGGKIYRAKREVLHPGRENIDQLYERFSEMDAFNFNSQYLQGRFHPWTERNQQGMWLWEHPEEGSAWHPELICGVFIYDNAECIRRTVFEDGTYMKNMRREQPEFSPEEWEAHAVENQRKLLEASKNFMI